MEIKDNNLQKNKEHYEKLYADYNIKNILHWLSDLDYFLDINIKTETSWFAMYQKDFRKKLKGKKILEMGCGDCVNAAIMAGLGAEVYANDLAAASGIIIKKLNDNYKFPYPIKFVEGDFLQNDLPSKEFDFIIGKAFLHHLEIPLEREFLKETSRLLKSDGEARFFEPAVNSRILDELRWHIPVKGRPSKFKSKAFKKWKENDPHPERSFSSKHWRNAGKEFFASIEIIPVGTIERLHKFIPNRKLNIKFRQWALKKEKLLPSTLNLYLTRSQLIIYKNPTLI